MPGRSPRPGRRDGPVGWSLAFRGYSRDYLAAEDQARKGGLLTVIGVREGAGIGCNLAVAVMDHFDRVKLTRRVGDGRTVLQLAAGLVAAD